MNQEILDVLIVGAGPGGIATAVECEIAGVKKVLLCEKTESHSGMLEKFYKAGKRIDKDYKKQVVELKGHIPFKDSFKEETLENFTNLLKEHHITPSYKTDIESVKKEANTLKSPPLLTQPIMLNSWWLRSGKWASQTALLLIKSLLRSLNKWFLASMIVRKMKKPL